MPFFPNLISKLKSNKLIKNSSIFFLGSMTMSVGNYLFHLISGRVLGPKDYGVLASLLSLNIILAVPTGVIAMVTVKLTSDIKVNKNYGELRFLIKCLLKSLSLIGLAVFFILCFLSPFIARFLKIPSEKLIILLGAIVFLSFLIPVVQGVLRGLQKFKSLALNMMVMPITKTVLVIILLFLGFRVYGALIAMLASSIAVFALGFKPLLFLFRFRPKNKIRLKKVLLYALPVLISLFCFTLLYNIDIIMVKHFFTETEAGLYSALSKLGQIIFFATGAIVGVMFPMVAEKYRKGEKHNHLLVQSLKIVALISGLGLSIYWLFPKIIMQILFGSAYLSVTPLVGFFGLAMSFLAMNNIFLNYYLSIHKFKFIYILALATVLEVILILFYHNSIKQIVFNVLVSMGLLFGGFCVFYFYQNKKHRDESLNLNPRIQRGR